MAETRKQIELMEKFRDWMTEADKAEQDNRQAALEDLGFLSGEGQWDPEVKKLREGRPCLTFNKLPKFVDQVTGDSRQNKPAIKIRPADSDSDVEMAEIYNGIIRNISQQSQADIARDTAQQCAAESGFGAYRIITEYTDDDAFEQDIRIKRIANPFSVYFDPQAKEWDRSDGRFCFITDVVTRKALEEEYPDEAKEITSWDKAESSWRNTWIMEDKVMLAEVFVRERVTKTLYLLSDGTVSDTKPAPPPPSEPMFPPPMGGMEGMPPQMPPEMGGMPLDMGAMPMDMPGMAPPPPYAAPPQQGMPSGMEGMMPPQPTGMEPMNPYAMPLPPPPEPVVTVERERQVKSWKVLWYKVAGDKILEGPKELPGKLIPVIPVFGKEINIQGKTIYRGVIRYAKDTQRMDNYWRSCTAEYLAYAPKSPWIGSPKMVEGFEHMWESSHKKAWPMLYCRPDPNFPGAMPQRIPPPDMPSALHQEAMMLADEYKSTTGIFDASLGARSNETSGRAILARQREADTGTFPFIDNLSRAMQLEARILLEWIPKIYDTERMVRVIGEDGSEDFVDINQVQADPVTGEPVIDSVTGRPVVINDLSYGKYDAVVTIGPSYATQRLEAADSMIQFVQAVPQAGAVMGDLLAGSMDWPNADEIADRLKKVLPPGMVDDEEGAAMPAAPPAPPEPPPPPPDPTLEIKVQQEQERLKGLQLDNQKKELEILKLTGQIESFEAKMIEEDAASAQPPPMLY